MKKIPLGWIKLFKTMMRIFVLLLTINVSLVAAPSIYSQQPRFNINEKNTNIIEVLNIIQAQSEFYFLYNHEAINKKKTFDIKINNGTIDDVLLYALDGSELNYKCVDNIIVLTPENTKLKPVTKTNIVAPETWMLTGIVVDENDVPLPGVNIMIKGTTTGTITNPEGVFKLNVEEESAVLIFSFVGYKSLEIEVNNNNPKINVQLEPSAESLDEVIVVAYNQQTKASFTGSAEAIDLNSVKTPPRESFNQSLQGNASGLYMQSASGQPGSYPNIRIRGISSVSGSNTPLYVIDDIPISKYDITSLATSSNIMAGINPEDIETITVLKDASATSLYGSRGANGVILITTKKGQKGKTKFNFSAQHGISEIIWLDRNKPLRTPEISELLIESRLNAGDTQQEAEQFIYSRIDSSINTDWYNELTRKGNFDKYTLSASGGNDNTTFYSSLSYHDQVGSIIGVDYKKLNGKINVRNTVSDKVVLDLGVSLNNQILHTVLDGGTAGNPIRVMTRAQPWYPIYNEDGSYNTTYFLTYNPIGLVNENIRETKIYSFLGNAGVKYFIFKGFSVESRVNSEVNLGDEFRYDNPDFGYGRNDGGIGRAWNNKVINWNWTNLVRYNFDINSKHKFELFGGHEAQSIENSEVYSYAQNYSLSGLTTMQNASVPVEATSSLTGSAIESYLASISYDFSERFHVNLSARTDGSSRFGSDVRWANFGSVGLAWNINNESFMAPVEFINDLKFRTSYGVTGNESGIGDHESKGLYRTGYNYNGEPGIQYYQQENALLTWEKNIPFNVGFDFGVFKRLSGSVEYFYRKTTSLLLDLPLSRVNGIDDYAENVGEMENQGWEITLKSNNIISDNFFWDTDFNVSTNKNKVTYLPGGPLLGAGSDQSFSLISEGYSFYSFFLPAYAGVDSDNGNALWYTDSTKTATTAAYDSASWFYQGSPLPKFFGGITNTFNYKGFTLSFLLYFQFGNKIYDTYGKYLNSDGTYGVSDKGNMSRKIYENRWQKPGDITDVPKVVWGNTQSGLDSQNSTRFLYDGSFVRLRDLSFSYNLPYKWTKRAKIKDATVYVRGSNVLTWTKSKTLEIDPEVGLNGIGDLRIPATRQIVFGLDIAL